MSPNTALGNRLRPIRHVIPPRDIRRRMVRTVDIVMFQDRLLVRAVSISGSCVADDVGTFCRGRGGDDTIGELGQLAGGGGGVRGCGWHGEDGGAGESEEG